MSHEYENMSADATNLRAPVKRIASRIFPHAFIRFAMQHRNCYSSFRIFFPSQSMIFKYSKNLAKH